MSPFSDSNPSSVPIHIIETQHFQSYLSGQSPRVQAWVRALHPEGSPEIVLLPTAQGGLERVILTTQLSATSVFKCLAKAAATLPAHHVYHMALAPDAFLWQEAFLGWALSCDYFGTLKTTSVPPPKPKLCWHESVEKERIVHLTAAISFVRRLITLPASHLPPEALCRSITEMLSPFNATSRLIKGEALLKANYPAIYTVGQASANPPCLLDMTWGNPSHPLVTLVGKGVCFDSGGLDLKPSAGMFLMKKDMGGAAIVAGVAYLIMALKLPIRLRLLIPAVENSISGNAYRPSDVITMRSGETVEVGNTDAEGRLILADCLYEASQDNPALLIDCATLTGAARVALGTDLPAVFSSPAALSFQMQSLSENSLDPVWPLPLHAPYGQGIAGKVSDLSSTGTSPHGGAITAALFLKNFVADSCPWIHMDMMAWNTKSSPGKPEGGEAQGLLTLLSYLEMHYSSLS